MHIGLLNLLAAAFLQASASAPSPSSPILLLFERALTMRDTVALTRAVDSSVIFHSRGRTDTLPREALWQLSQPILTAFPDIRFVVEDEIRAGEKIAARVTLTGIGAAIFSPSRISSSTTNRISGNAVSIGCDSCHNASRGSVSVRPREWKITLESTARVSATVSRIVSARSNRRRMGELGLGAEAEA